MSRTAIVRVAAILLVACSITTPAHSQVRITELRIDQPGVDSDEYLEISGPPGEHLASHTYVVIGDGAGGSGVIEMALDLGSLTIPSDGVAFVAEDAFSLGPVPDMQADLAFENSDNVTHLLVTGFSGSAGMDIDVDDDGLLDDTPWTQTIDCVSILDSSDSGDRVYCPTEVGPDGGSAPFHVYHDGGWQIGPKDPLAGVDTPGRPPVVLPLQSVHLTALLHDRDVLFRWSIDGGTDYRTFVVAPERTDDLTAAPQDLALDARGPGEYEAVFRDLVPGPYRFILHARRTDRSSDTLGHRNVFVPYASGTYLTHPYPNPARKQFEVGVRAPAGGHVEVTLFNSTGRRLRRLYSGTPDAGAEVRLQYDAADLAPGLYFVRATSPGGVTTRGVHVRR